MRALLEFDRRAGRSFRRRVAAAGLADRPLPPASDHSDRYSAVPCPSGDSRPDLLRPRDWPCIRGAAAAYQSLLTGAFGVLYVGKKFEGSFAETVLRNPLRRFVSQNYVSLRAVSEVTASRDLKVVDFHGPGLSAVGLTNAISTGPYNPCWAWSDYLWSHRDRPDGIAYTSRHDPQQICYAIFERPDITFGAAPATQLSTLMPVIRVLLRQYGKILTRP